MFSNRIEEYRKELGLTKLQMAEKLNITESYYSLLVNNKRGLSKPILKKIVEISNKDEKYWEYGVLNSDNSCESKCESILKTYELLKTYDYINKEFVLKLFNCSNDNDLEKVRYIEQILIEAIKNDLKKIIKEK